MEPNEEIWLGIGYLGAVVISIITWALVVHLFEQEPTPVMFLGLVLIGCYRIYNGVQRGKNS